MNQVSSTKLWQIMCGDEQEGRMAEEKEEEEEGSRHSYRINTEVEFLDPGCLLSSL